MPDGPCRSEGAVLCKLVEHRRRLELGALQTRRRRDVDGRVGGRGRDQPGRRCVATAIR